MTKSLSDDWMLDRGFCDGDIIAQKNYPTWWASKKVYEMPINTPLTITSDVRCKDAIALLKKEGFDMVPVLAPDGAVIGVVTEGNITKCILSGRCDPESNVAESGVIYKTFHKFTMNSTLESVAHALDHDPFVLIVTEQRCFAGTKRKADGDEPNNPQVMTRSVVSGIVSRIDLLDFISSGSK
jgi:cystathionine beta-synthase